MIYSVHPKFNEDMTSFLKKHHQDDGWLFKLQNLLINHFEKNAVILGVNVLAPLKEYGDYKLWKVYMAVGGVSKNNRPRVCFAKRDNEIIFLCFGTHINNYNTKELIVLGIKRIKEFIGATHSIQNR